MTVGRLPSLGALKEVVIYHVAKDEFERLCERSDRTIFGQIAFTCVPTGVSMGAAFLKSRDCDCIARTWGCVRSGVRAVARSGVQRGWKPERHVVSHQAVACCVRRLCMPLVYRWRTAAA